MNNHWFMRSKCITWSTHHSMTLISETKLLRLLASLHHCRISKRLRHQEPKNARLNFASPSKLLTDNAMYLLPAAIHFHSMAYEHQKTQRYTNNGRQSKVTDCDVNDYRIWCQFKDYLWPQHNPSPVANGQRLICTYAHLSITNFTTKKMPIRYKKTSVCLLKHMWRFNHLKEEKGFGSYSNGDNQHRFHYSATSFLDP